MIKKCISVFLGVWCSMTLTAFAATPGSIDESLLEYSTPDGASKFELDYFELSKPGQVFSIDKRYTTYDFIPLSDEENGCYLIKRGEEIKEAPYFMNPFWLDVKPNRNYKVTALVWCDFDRDDCEVNMGMYIRGKDEKTVTLIDTFHGLPADTGGEWFRFETTVTTPPDAMQARFYGEFAGFKAEDDGEFYIADVDVFEMPEEELIPLGVGEGLNFGGSSGMLDMKIESVFENDEIISIAASGAKYEFYKLEDTINVSQQIGQERIVASLTPDKSLRDLKILTNTDKEVILTTGEGGLSFGVQMDGLMLVSTHGDDVQIRVESKIGGLWNRLLDGNLIAMDEVGGFTVNPAIPLGTGRVARCLPDDGIDFERSRGDVDFISSANKGWEITWSISSGERLGITAFPPREYDWENSFDCIFANITDTQETSVYKSYRNSHGVKYGVLWNFAQCAWGMSFGDTYKIKSEEDFTKHISAAKKAGISPLEYMSMYFWDDTLDAYIKEVTRHKTEYGIEGVYTDGVPPIDWLKAYEGMRKLREVFPDGCIIAHTTGQISNGGAPLAVPEISIPAIDAYATITLRGESVEGSGKDWVYPRFMTSGFGVSNAFGVQKGDRWLFEGSKLNQDEQYLINLLYNGRARRDSGNLAIYREITEKLRSNWQSNSWSKDYYESCYLPYMRRLVREQMEEFEYTTVFNEEFEDNLPWKGNSDNAIIENGKLKFTPGARAEFDFLPSYGKTGVSLDFKAQGENQWRIDMLDSYGNVAISLMGNGEDMRLLDRKKGYRNSGYVWDEENKYIEISADPAQKKFSIAIDGESIVENLNFSGAVSEISKIRIVNEFGDENIFVDNLNVNSGL